MPTLVEMEVEASVDEDFPSNASETLLLDESTFLGEPGVDDQRSAGIEPKGRNRGSSNQTSGNVGNQNDATFDDSVTILSRTLLSDGESRVEQDDERTVDMNKQDDSITLLDDRSQAKDVAGNRGDESMILTIDRERNPPGDESTILSIDLVPRGGVAEMDIEQNRTGEPTRRNHPHISGTLEAGPYERAYRSNYEVYVKGKIQDFKQRFPGRLRDYRSMSVEEKAGEQQDVVALLTRLGISRGANTQPNDHGQALRLGRKASQADQTPPSRLYGATQDDTMSPLHSPQFRSSKRSEESCGLNSQSSKAQAGLNSQSSKAQADDFFQGNKSAILLSPVQTLGSPQFLHNDENSAGFDDDMGHMSSESVELVRGDQSVSSASHLYESPERSQIKTQKRLATTSGKRGAGLARWKYNEDFVPPVCDGNSGSGSEVEPSSHHDILSFPSPSSNPGDVFVASQSPISPRLTYCSSDDDDAPPSDGGRFVEEVPNYRRASVETIESMDTPGMSQHLMKSKSKSRHLREIPANVNLKDGVTFHLDKLSVKRTELVKVRGAKNKQRTRRRLVSFPDPLSSYGSRERERLQTVLDWIKEYESEMEDEECIPSGAIFSLSETQIIDVTLKLLLEGPDDQQERRDSAPEGTLVGQTVIVGRDKEDLVRWESALREGTGYSVLNHATLPLTERIRASAAEKAALYDVVLTTFDSLKSADTAIPVDSLGHAITKNVGSDDGWYSSRTASQSCSGPQRTKQLSVLHRVKFRRCIFVDILGRKCFLAKGGTNRASAAVALHGDSR
jgi:hypothetical protein